MRPGQSGVRVPFQAAGLQSLQRGCGSVIAAPVLPHEVFRARAPNARCCDLRPFAAPVARDLCPVAAQNRPLHSMRPFHARNRDHHTSRRDASPNATACSFASPLPLDRGADRTITQLRHLGLSCSQIAAEIGVTRNAVIGKIHRLGLSPGGPRRRRVPALHAPGRRGLAATPVAAPEFTQAPNVAGAEAAPAAVESMQRCSLLDLAPGQMSLAGRRSVRSGFCLLRQSGRRRLSVLRRPRANGLSRSGAAARLADTSFPGRHACASRGHGARRLPPCIALLDVA